ncbi:MAG: ribosomal-processing cysteine protease Prp [Aminivibrio sp.]|jgi:uncharacterized protein YsxB (DUF464 family)
MTEVSVGLSEGRYAALSAAGHTGFSESGSDVVCAAVSTLVQALHYGFIEVLKREDLRCESDREKTRITLDWRSCKDEAALVLADTVVGSLKEIARAYPGHVRILEVPLNEMEF